MRKASMLVQKWVEKGHQNVESAVTPAAATATEVLEISKAGESVNTDGSAESFKWKKDSMKNFMSILQVGLFIVATSSGS